MQQASFLLIDRPAGVKLRYVQRIILKDYTPCKEWDGLGGVGGGVL